MVIVIIVGIRFIPITCYCCSGLFFLIRDINFIVLWLFLLFASSLSV